MNFQMLPNADGCVVWACPNTGVAVAPPNRPPVVGVLLPNSDELVAPKAGAVNPVVVVFPKVCPNGLAVAPLLKPPPPEQQKLMLYITKHQTEQINI